MSAVLRTGKGVSKRIRLDNATTDAGYFTCPPGLPKNAEYITGNNCEYHCKSGYFELQKKLHQVQISCRLEKYGGSPKPKFDSSRMLYRILQNVLCWNCVVLLCHAHPAITQHQYLQSILQMVSRIYEHVCHLLFDSVLIQ